MTDDGSCNMDAHGCPDAVDRKVSGMDSSLEAFSYNPNAWQLRRIAVSGGGYTDGANWWFLSY